TQQQRRAQPAPCSAVTVFPDHSTPHRPAVSRTRKSQPCPFSERTKQPGYFSEKMLMFFLAQKNFRIFREIGAGATAATSLTPRSATDSCGARWRHGFRPPPARP